MSVCRHDPNLSPHDCTGLRCARMGHCSEPTASELMTFMSTTLAQARMMSAPLSKTASPLDCAERMAQCAEQLLQAVSVLNAAQATLESGPDDQIERAAAATVAAQETVDLAGEALRQAIVTFRARRTAASIATHNSSEALAHG